VAYTSAVTTSAVTLTSTIVSKEGTLPFYCSFKYWDVEPTAGEEIDAQITSTQPIYIYIMTGGQVNQFQHTCGPAGPNDALVLQGPATSFQINWTAPADDTYYFIFFDFNPSNLNPVYSNLYIYSVQSGQTVVYTTGQIAITGETEIVSTVSSPVVVPSISSWILLVLAGIALVGLLVYSKRGKKPNTTKTSPPPSHVINRSNLMISKPALITILLLALAVVTFAGLTYQTVPTSTTQTVTQMPVQTWFSYLPYLETNTSAYTTTEAYTYSYYSGPSYCNVGGCNYGAVSTITTTFANTLTLNSTYQVQEITTITSSRTVTSSTTESSTSLVPAYSSVGLSGAAFGALSIVVIGVLVFCTAWILLRETIHHKPKQATLSQFMKATPSCIKCGAQLPPASEFCNKCGTKQS
jgi:ribosomal protein L40E/Tfp pilus assembly protein PilV